MTRKRALPIEQARFRYGLLFPLLCKGENLERGEQTEIIRRIATTPVVFPGEDHPRMISERTLLRWLAQLRAHEPAFEEPARRLLRRERSDHGTVRLLSSEQMDWLRMNTEAYPRWSYSLHADNLWHTGLQPKVSRSTVYRWMKSQGLIPLTLRGGSRKRRSTLLFESEFPGELVHFDFHTSSVLRVLGDCGSWLKPKCVAFIDDRSRFGLHIQWFLTETTADLVHAKIQSYLKYGIHLRDMSDNGSAMIAAEYNRGLKQLGVQHERTVPRSPYQNGKIESFWKPLEGRLMAMLSKVKPLTLEFLNEASIAWLEQDYNGRFHSEVKAAPRSLWFSDDNVSRRPAPSSETLRRLFRRRVTRRQRHEDHTITLEGVRYQLPELVWGVDTLTVAYAAWNRDLVTIIDPFTEKELADIFPVDRVENAMRRTRRASEDQHADDPITGEESKQLGSTAALPPFLSHLLEAHRQEWGVGVVNRPQSRPFKEAEIFITKE